MSVLFVAACRFRAFSSFVNEFSRVGRSGTGTLRAFAESVRVSSACRNRSRARCPVIATTRRVPAETLSS